MKQNRVYIKVDNLRDMPDGFHLFKNLRQGYLCKYVGTTPPIIEGEFINKESARLIFRSQADYEDSEVSKGEGKAGTLRVSLLPLGILKTITNNLRHGTIKDNCLQRIGRRISMWANFGNDRRAIGNGLWSNKRLRKHKFSNNGVSKRPERESGSTPRKTRLADRVAVAAVVCVLWLLALHIVPNKMSELTDKYLMYYIIEFSLYSSLSLAAGVTLFTRENWAMTAITVLAFSNFSWFGWAMLTKINMMVTDTYSYVGFTDTELHDKILSCVSIGFIITIFLKLWKHRRSRLV